MRQALKLAVLPCLVVAFLCSGPYAAATDNGNKSEPADKARKESAAKEDSFKDKPAKAKAAEADAGKSRSPEAPSLGRVGKAAKASSFTPEREAAALTFVRAHHPELGSLLERLKPMNRPEYEQAIGELFDVSENLANLSLRDQKRYDVALEAWKARSRVELLAAQLASDPSPELESQLHQAVEAQLNVELRQQRLEKETLETRLHKVNETIDRLEENRDKLIESRYHSLLKKSQRVHQRGAGKPGPEKAQPTKGESKA